MAKQQGPEIDPLELFSNAIDTVPPDVEGARQAIVAVNELIRTRQGTERLDLVQEAAALSGEMATRMSTEFLGEPVQKEFQARKDGFEMLASVLGGSGKPQEERTRTDEKVNTEGKKHSGAK